MDLRPDRIMPRHFLISPDQVPVRYRPDILRRLRISGRDRLPVSYVCQARKVHRIPLLQCMQESQDRLITFSQQDVVTVFHSFLIIHGSMESAHNNDRPAVLLQIARQLISPHCRKCKDPDKDHIRIQHIFQRDPGNGFAVHQSVVHLSLHDRRQRIQAHRRRPDIPVINDIIQQRRPVRAVSRFDKSHFHFGPSFIVFSHNYCSLSLLLRTASVISRSS